MKINLNTSIKSHALLGLVLGIWLVLFLIFIAPFDASTVSIKIRFLIMPPYGLIFFLCYLIIILIQKWIYKKIGYWNLFWEFFVILLFYGLALTGIFQYYTSSIVNGDFDFQQFTYTVYLPILLILSTLLFFGRWLINYRSVSKTNKSDNKLILKGANKMDILKIDFDQLVCLSSAQNYVEVFYLQNQVLQKKLLRTTLKKISQDISGLTQVHRSHIINPLYFVKWTSPNSILLKEIEIPISKNYKQGLTDLL